MKASVRTRSSLAKSLRGTSGTLVSKIQDGDAPHYYRHKNHMDANIYFIAVVGSIESELFGELVSLFDTRATVTDLLFEIERAWHIDAVVLVSKDGRRRGRRRCRRERTFASKKRKLQLRMRVRGTRSFPTACICVMCTQSKINTVTSRPRTRKLAAIGLVFGFNRFSPHDDHPRRRRLFIFSCPTMVKSTMVVRASDFLPLAASVDDEEVRLDRSTLIIAFPDPFSSISGRN